MFAVLATVAVMSAGPVVAAELAGLARLRQVSVHVDVDHPLAGMTVEDLSARLLEALARAGSSLSVADGAVDRIRLLVAVRPTSATELRGFWLPFSGTYGVGAVRLAVERVVTLPGTTRAFPAVVWQTERVVGAPWHLTDREIVRLLDEMVAELLEARRN
jgi:hypothetical protein